MPIWRAVNKAFFVYASRLVLYRAQTTGNGGYLTDIRKII